MKTVKQISILISVLLLFATACTQSFTKEGYIRNYEAWITSLKKDYTGYNEADWTRAEAEFKRYSEIEYSKFKDELTMDERKKVDQLTGQYYGVLAKYKARQIQDEIMSVINVAKGMFEELKK